MKSNRIKQTNHSAETDYSELRLSRRSVVSAGLSLPLFTAAVGNKSATGIYQAEDSTRTAWKADTTVNTHPVIHNGLVFTISAEGVVQANSIETGTNVWRRTLGVSPYFSSIGISGSTLLAGGYGGDLLAVDHRSGDEEWKRTLSGDVLALAAAGDNTIVTTYGAVQSIRTADGRINWKRDLSIYNDDLRPSSSFPFSGTPVVLGSSVFVRTKDGVAALRLSDGEVIWQATDPGEVPEKGHGLEIAIVEDKLFFVSTVLTTVDINTGDVTRVTEFAEPIRQGFGVEHGLAGPVTNGELVFTGANAVHAVDVVTGETVWTGGGIPYPWHGLAYDEQGSNLYVSTITGDGTFGVISLDASTGVENWSQTLGKKRRSYSLYVSFISRVVATEDVIFVAVRGESSFISAIRTEEISVDIGDSSSNRTEQSDEPTTTDSPEEQQSISTDDDTRQDAEYRGLVSNNPDADIGNQLGDMYLLTVVSTALSIFVMLGQAFRRRGE